MTLDEAIKHCKEKAEELRAEAIDLDSGEAQECLECANEHEQLANWLEDYKRLLGEKSYAMGYQDGLEDGLNDIRPKGKWIGVVYSKNRIGVGMCNQCEANRIIDNFCPYCGADMRGGTE